MKEEDAEQLSLYEVEEMIGEAEALSYYDQVNLLIAYDEIIKFLEEGKKYEWSSTTLVNMQQHKISIFKD